MGRLVLLWICVVALVAPSIGCTDETTATGGTGGSGDTGSDGGIGGAGEGGVGGAGGSGGIGGVGDGACTGEADQAAYADLTYTDAEGSSFTGTAASAAIGSDCIFGAETSDPVLEGCGDEAFAVVSCFPNCDPSIFNALADCVATCTQDATGLSTECMACTGDTVACGAAFCTAQCVADTNAPVCIDCRCDNDCTPGFDDCSGLPPGSDCGP